MSIAGPAVGVPFRVRAPASWHYVNLAGDREAEVAALVDRATARLDRDTAAARRHRMRESVSASLAECETQGGVVAVQGALLPVPAGDTASVIPASITCATVQIPDSGLRPVEVLVAAARTDPTAKPTPAGSGVALRTHQFRDVRERFVERVKDPSVPARQRSRILAEAPDAMFAFRVDYLTGRRAPDVWVRMSLSALVPVDDVRHELPQAYLELGDAVVSTFAWVEKS